LMRRAMLSSGERSTAGLSYLHGKRIVLRLAKTACCHETCCQAPRGT
jgi:hypothetical protein